LKYKGYRLMLKLILVRHGETDSSKKGTYCGWTDVELNEQGIRQARKARDILKGLKINAIISSPLKRAFRTAEIINEEFNMEITCCESLRERCFGVWEDLTYETVCERFAEELKHWKKDWINYCIEDGESALEAYNRTVGFIDKLVENNDNGTFIIVTHLGCIRSIISHLLGMGIEGQWRFRVENGRIQLNEEKFAYLTALNL
jgi:alpha-ribazole phosphatase